MEVDKKIVLFDGVCNLCNGAVKFIIKRDKTDQFRFAALQSEIGLKLAEEFGFSVKEMDSIILLDADKWYKKSSAALRIAKSLRGYKWAGIFLYLPRGFRDFIYDIIAKNRYRWFGKRNSCMIPTPELKAKFLK